MKINLNISDKQAGYFLILLITGFLIWYNYSTLYLGLYSISKKDLVVVTLFNVNSIFFLLGIYTFGMKDGNKFVFSLITWVLGIMVYVLYDTITHFHRSVCDFATVIIFSFFIAFFLNGYLLRIKRLMDADSKPKTPGSR